MKMNKAKRNGKECKVWCGEPKKKQIIAHEKRNDVLYVLWHPKDSN